MSAILKCCGHSRLIDGTATIIRLLWCDRVKIRRALSPTALTLPRKRYMFWRIEISQVRNTIVRKLLLAILFIVPAPIASADDIYDKCSAEAVTNPDFAKCGGEWVARADTRLNKTWRELNARFGDRDEAKGYLLTEQRLWNTYKESSCLFYNADFGREGQVIHFPICRAMVIEQRVKDLESFGSDVN